VVGLTYRCTRVREVEEHLRGKELHTALGSSLRSLTLVRLLHSQIRRVLQLLAEKSEAGRDDVVGLGQDDRELSFLLPNKVIVSLY